LSKATAIDTSLRTATVTTISTEIRRCSDRETGAKTAVRQTSFSSTRSSTVLPDFVKCSDEKHARPNEKHYVDSERPIQARRRARYDR
jgi:hypothetical protein